MVKQRAGTRLCAALILFAVFMVRVEAAFHGEVELVNGRIVSGELRFADGAFELLEEEKPLRIQPGELKSLQCQSVSEEALRQTKGGGNGLEATYFTTDNLSGKSFKRIDPQINFNWAGGSPMKDVGGDHFSVRWTGQVEAPAGGNYKFYLESDDGAKLWVNGKLLVEQWRDQSATEGSGSIELEAGKKYDLKAEYYERAGEAVARLSWSGPSLAKQVVPSGRLFTEVAQSAPPNRGLLGLYYNGRNLTGPTVRRVDPTINFQWGSGSPMSGIEPENFSVRWLGKLVVKKTQAYSFRPYTDDGVRLWVNNQLIIDQWRNGPLALQSELVQLQSGQEYNIRMDYFEGDGDAYARLTWRAPSIEETVIPAEQLIPARAEAVRKHSFVERRIRPAGVLLRGGSLLARQVHSADDSQVRFSSSIKDPGVSLVNVAWIVFDALPITVWHGLVEGRQGLLLRNRDFIDCEFRSFKNGKVQVNSILFGLREFDRGKVWAIILQEPRPNAAAFEVVSKDGSRLRVDGFDVSEKGLIMRGQYFNGMNVPSNDLLEIVRLDGAGEPGE